MPRHQNPRQSKDKDGPTSRGLRMDTQPEERNPDTPTQDGGDRIYVGGWGMK